MTPDNSIKNTILKRIEGEKRAQEFVRNHQKRHGGVSFGDADETPLVQDTIQVIGKPYEVKTEKGIKKITPKARIIFLSDGSTDVIKGGLGDSVTEEDAVRILGKAEKRRLKISLKPRNGVK